MKTKLIAITALLCLLLAALTACGSSNQTAATGADSGSGQEAASPAAAAEDVQEAAEAETEAAAPTAAGETFDVGAFTFELPAGWTAFPQSDMFGEKDAEGNYPIDETLIYFSKEAKDEWDLFSKPYVIFKYSPASTTVMTGRDSMYKDTEDIEVTVDNAEVTEAFEGTSTFFDDEVWRYQIALLKYDNGQIQVTVPVIAEDNETGLSIAAPEIAAAINSITIK